MFKMLKCLHLIGLTLFLGSIWVYIVMGTPLEPQLITAYVRHSVSSLVMILTLPGLLLMITTGIGMSLLRRRLISPNYLMTKSILSFVIITISYFVIKSIRLSASLVDKLPADTLLFQQALKHEVIFGAINVSLILITITYAIYAVKYRKKGVL
jgi:hypothetical protein